MFLSSGLTLPKLPTFYNGRQVLHSMPHSTALGGRERQQITNFRLPASQFDIFSNLRSCSRRKCLWRCGLCSTKEVTFLTYLFMVYPELACPCPV